MRGTATPSTVTLNSSNHAVALPAVEATRTAHALQPLREHCCVLEDVVARAVRCKQPASAYPRLRSVHRVAGFQARGPSEPFLSTFEGKRFFGAGERSAAGPKAEYACVGGVSRLTCVSEPENPKIGPSPLQNPGTFAV